MLNHPVLYTLSDSIKVAVPLHRTLMDNIDIQRYESDFIQVLSDYARKRLPGSITLIDGGADFGLFSLKLVSMISSIRRILAFEPNAEGYVYLKLNLDRLSFTADAIPKALADFDGHGSLDLPPANFSLTSVDYAAQFLTRSPRGPILVTTIDSLAISHEESLIIKLDLEGGELAALRGAARTIQAASNIFIAFEAHPLVALRTGVDPIECLRLLSSWRTFRFVAAECGTALDIRRPLFEQLPRKIHNLIAISV